MEAKHERNDQSNGKSCKTAYSDGEDIETILAGWPKLSEEEKQEIRDAIG